MRPDLSLKENVAHGTEKNPIMGIHFQTGPGTEFPEPFFIGRHWHHTIEILYITKGNYVCEINLEEHALREGDICFFNGEELHQIRACSAGTQHEAILFDPRILDFSYQDEWELNVISPFVGRRQLLTHFLHQTDESYSILKPLVLQLMNVSLERPAGWYVTCKLLLLQLIRAMYECGLMITADETLSPGDKQKIDRYKNLVSYMEQNYARPITLQDLTDLISCNPQYLCRFFKEITDTSPMQYLISLRVEHACALLAGTARPILDISLDCGFENVSYFIRKFRQLKGCTPKEYRKNHSWSF